MKKFSVETLLYVLIGAVALYVRLLNLGDAPLLLTEAREALGVFRFTTGLENSLVTASPAWFTLTSFLFALFGSSEFTARLISALAGTAIVFIPITFRNEIGKLAALTSAALLAISAVAVASARAADGTTLTLLGFWLLVIGVKRYLPNENQSAAILAGIGLGLSLASGVRFFSALGALTLAFVAMLIVRPLLLAEAIKVWGRLQKVIAPLLLSAGLTFGLLASAGLLNRAGLSAALQTVPLWLEGWVPTTASRAVYLIPQILGVYEPLIIFVIVCALYVAFFSALWHRWFVVMQNLIAPARIDDQGDSFGSFALTWRNDLQVWLMAALGALLFTLVYSGREASDALWVLLPLVFVVGKCLAELFSGEWLVDEAQTVWAQAGVLSVMLVFAYFNVAALPRTAVLVPQTIPYLSLWLALAVLLLGGVITLLFASGWSTLSAARGAMVALGFVLLVGSVSSMWGVTQVRPNDPRELWLAAPTAAQIKLLRQSLFDISHRAAGFKYDLEIVVLNDPVWNDRDGVLGWELRSFANVKFVDTLAPQMNAPVVIADGAISEPTLGAAYAGQSFPFWVRSPRPEVMPVTEVVDWWLYRAAKVEYARKVLWVRQDVQLLVKK